MRWRGRARYSAYSAGDPPLPGETPPDDPPPGEAPGVASASPWPGRATTPAPPSPPLAVVVDSSARPECPAPTGDAPGEAAVSGSGFCDTRSEEHTSELQSRSDLVCRLLLEKKNYKIPNYKRTITNASSASSSA